MSRSFRVEHGPYIQDLKLAVAAQRQIMVRDTLGYLKLRCWDSAAAHDQTVVRFSKAMAWLFRKIYFDSHADVTADLAFIRSREVPNIDFESPRTDAQWLVASDFLTASAASDWFSLGGVPTAPLRKASDCFMARFKAIGVGNRTAADFIAASTRDKAEIVYAEEFVRRALCEDWSWIVGQFEPGFVYLLRMKHLSADGAIISYCYSLAQFAIGEVCLGLEGGAREALTRCNDSWRVAVVKQRPWDRAVYVLYFCVYAFERTICGRSVTVQQVNSALLGELA